MAQPPALDLALLRTFVAIAEEGSFTRAAERVGRTQSAVTLQMQRLEASLGQLLLVRAKGAPVGLTGEGRALLRHAQKMLALNDEALLALATRAPATFRLGTSDTYARYYLQRSLARAKAAFPDVMIEVLRGRSCQMAPQIKENAFDLVVCEGGHEPRGWRSSLIWKGPLKWIVSDTEPIHTRLPLPLSLYPSDCPWRPAWMDDCYWRSATLHTLREAGRPHRVVSVSDNEEGHLASVLAGEAVTVAVEMPLPPGLRFAREEDGLPPLPEQTIVILKSRAAVQPLTDEIAGIIASEFRVGA